MGYQPESMNYLGTQWLEESDIPFHQMTEKEIGREPIDFGFVIGQHPNTILGYIDESDPTKMNFEMKIDFSEGLQNITVEMNKEIYDDLFLKITDTTIKYDVKSEFQLNEKQQITTLVMTTSIDNSAFTRDRFLQTLKKCVLIKKIIYNMIVNRLRNYHTSTNNITTTLADENKKFTLYC